MTGGARSKRLRRIFAILVALLAVPGTFWRTALPPPDYSARVFAQRLPTETAEFGPFRVEGTWQLISRNSEFGGFSALVALEDGSLLAGSDSGKALRLFRPGRPDLSGTLSVLGGNANTDKRDSDLEGLTRDPGTGRIWGSYEHTNALVRYDAGFEAEARSQPPAIAEWGSNSGAEAFGRLQDGRFLAIREAQRGSPGLHDGVIFHGDPAAPGTRWEAFRFESPPGFRPVDVTQLRGGTVLVLLRRLSWSLPPGFLTGIAVLDTQKLAAGEVWRPERVFYLPGGVPTENYEGIAAIPGGARSSETVWLISDDNFSAFQRTQLLELAYRPRQKARGKAARPSKTPE